MDGSRAAAGAILVGILGAVGATLFAPGLVRPVVASVESALATGLRETPVPVLVAVALALGVVLWFVAVRYLLILAYRAWRRISARLYRLLTLFLPESPLVKFASGTMVLIAVTILIVGALPVLVGGDSVEPDWNEVVDGDAVFEEPGCEGAGSSIGGSATDRDGDGLPDAWERAGETPDGAPLPGADPGRKDLYVQVNYGSDVDPLTDTERSQLRESWAAMPVDNPDGSEGISLHVHEPSPGAGDIGRTATLTAPNDVHDFYTADRMGSRRCVYRLVVYGDVQVDGVNGVGSSPGYATFVTGNRDAPYPGTVGPRVAVTNHELLHTAVGRFDGKTHATEGWLAPGSGDEFLSGPVAGHLGETGIHGPAN